MKLLIIEDQDSLREILETALQKEKYIVESAADYSSALEKLSVYSYDLILLDIMLPDGNGLDLLRLLKKNRQNESVLILSAKDSIEDKVAGLEIGADDYLAKPFHLTELQARIRSILRRKHSNGQQIVSLGNLSIDIAALQAFVNGKALDLSRKEYDILYYLLTRRSHITPKEVLAEAVWGDYIDQCDNFDFIYAQVKNLRRKLQSSGATIEVRSVYGMGYKMEEIDN